MSFCQMMNILREGNRGKIVFVNTGVFYIAVEEDAVLLNNKLKLKCTCFQKNTCKVGIPITVLEKHLKRIEKINYSYIVYNFNKQEKTLKKIKEYKGKENKTKRKNINCIRCKGIEAYKEDEYLEALRKMYGKELGYAEE